MLLRRGVDAATADDAVQETALRALAVKVPFDDAESLLRWANVVSWRIVLQARRRDQRLSPGAPDLPASVDLDREVEARRRVDALFREFPRLSSQDKSAILDSSVGTSRKDSVRLAVRRHRARARLLAMMDSAAGALILVWLRLRRVNASRRVVVAAIAPVALAVLSLAALPQAHRPASPHGRGALYPTSVPQSVTVAPRAVAADPHHGRGDRRAPEQGPGPRQLPRLTVHVPTPVGPAGVWGRPKAPEDHFFCLDADLVGSHCVDLPVRITR